MKMDAYKVKFDYAYEKDGKKERAIGSISIFASSPEAAKKGAKERALEGLRRQGAKVIFMDIKEPEYEESPIVV